MVPRDRTPDLNRLYYVHINTTNVKFSTHTLLSLTFPTSSLVSSVSAASTFIPTPNCSDTDSFKNHKSSVVSETMAVPIS